MTKTKIKKTSKIKNKTKETYDLKEKFEIKEYLTKENIIYFLVALADIIIIIYSARKNIINYVTIENKNPIYLGAKHNLFFGRNYITIVTTIITYIYIIILNKFYLKKELKIKQLILLLFLILIVNCIIFYLFTIKVY